jgi:hypothetical protein
MERKRKMNENEIVKDLLLAMIQKSKLNNEKLLEFVCNSYIYIELYKTIKKQMNLNKY